MSRNTEPEVPTEPIEFPYKYIHVPWLGKVFYPYIPISLETVDGWKDFEFLVDTGADFTTLPRRTEEILGIDLDKCKESRAASLLWRVVRWAREKYGKRD